MRESSLKRRESSKTKKQADVDPITVIIPKKCVMEFEAPSKAEASDARSNNSAAPSNRPSVYDQISKLEKQKKLQRSYLNQ